MKYSKSISWIDDCRIPFVDDIWVAPKKPRTNLGIKLSKGNEERGEANTQGRFPANILVSDDMLNDGNITKNGDIKPHKQKRKTCYFTSENVTSSFKSDKGTNSRYYDIDKWFDKILNYE